MLRDNYDLERTRIADKIINRSSRYPEEEQGRCKSARLRSSCLEQIAKEDIISEASEESSNESCDISGRCNESDRPRFD
jgi:hypothetical protein